MKKIVIILWAIIACAPSFAQKESGTTKKLKEIWNSNEDPGTKAAKVKDLKLKEADISLADHYAASLITFQAEQDKDVVMQSLIKSFETLPPNAKKELESHYTNIVALYDTFALSKNLKLFQFQAELTTSLQLKDIDVRNKDSYEPTFYANRMRYYTIAIQQELYKSQNLLILPTYKKIMNLWASLTQAQKDSLDKIGYPNFWQEQIKLYNHKFENKYCVCGTQQASFSTLPDCGIKFLTLKTKEKDLDRPTFLLIQLTNGNLAAVEDAQRDNDVSSYSGSKDNIVSQLVFLHVATITTPKINSTWRISLVYLWDKNEANGSNDYNKRIGLTREMLEGLEKYYSCQLGLKILNPNQPEKPEVVKKDPAGVPEPVIKPILTSQPSANRAQPRVSKFVAAVQNASNVYQIRDDLDIAVQNEIINREDTNMCAETIAVDDTTLRLSLMHCGKGKGVFRVLEVETELVGDFFNYCTNVLADLLVDYRHQAGGKYEVTIIGTADKLKYKDNEGLAIQRAEFVKANLGKKLIADCKDSEIKTVGLIDQDERKVTIQVILHKPQGIN